MKVAVQRAKAGAASDIAIEIAQAVYGGQDWDGALADAAAQIAIDKYRKHIAAALRARGVEFGDSEELNAESVLSIVNARAGLSIEDWSPGAIVAELDSLMSERLSDSLGVQVDTVQDFDGIKAALIAGAVDAVQSGRGNAIVPQRLVDKYQKAKAFVDGNIAKDDRKKLLSRWYQKKYRRKHVSVWY